MYTQKENDKKPLMCMHAYRYVYKYVYINNLKKI